MRANVSEHHLGCCHQMMIANKIRDIFLLFPNHATSIHFYPHLFLHGYNLPSHEPPAMKLIQDANDIVGTAAMPCLPGVTKCPLTSPFPKTSMARTLPKTLYATNLPVGSGNWRGNCRHSARRATRLVPSSRGISKISSSSSVAKGGSYVLGPHWPTHSKPHISHGDCDVNSCIHPHCVLCRGGRLP
jgi:hypothetical protein